MINDIFEALGFKEEEVRTYLTLMDIGTSTGGEVSKKMGLPRPSVYGYLDRLIEGGLVTQSRRRGVKVFTPEPADRLRTLYSRKLNDLKQKENALDNIIPDLERKMGTRLFRPKFQIYEGRDGMEAALQDHLSHSDGEMLAFWSIRSAIEATSEDFFWFLNKERIRRNLYLKGIWPPEQAVEVRRYPFMGVGNEFKREIRVAPEGIESSMGYWIYANKVLFASSRAESFCFIIESTELVQMMTNQHRVIWEMSTPLSVDKKDMQPFLNDLYSD